MDDRNGENEYTESRGDDRIDDSVIDDERLRFDAKEKLAYPTAVYE